MYSVAEQNAFCPEPEYFPSSDVTPHPVHISLIMAYTGLHLCEKS